MVRRLEEIFHRTVGSHVLRHEPPLPPLGFTSFPKTASSELGCTQYYPKRLRLSCGAVLVYDLKPTAAPAWAPPALWRAPPQSFAE